jgi:hypothetical protein
MDTFIAPNLSKFVSAAIPDRSELAATADTWLPDFVLRSIFTAPLAGNLAKYGFMFMRRAAAAVRSYELARIATSQFLAAHTRQELALSLYAQAADLWDSFVAQADQALKLLSHVPDQRIRLFEAGDRSLIERLHKLHDNAKHAEARVHPGSSAQAAFTVWLTTIGLKSRSHHLTWIEAAALVDFFARVIRRLKQEIFSKYDVS